jgi:ankyrin repeat protein
MKKHSYAFLLFSCFVFLCAAPDCVTSKGRSIDHEFSNCSDKCDEQKVKALLKQGANVMSGTIGQNSLDNAVSCCIGMLNGKLFLFYMSCCQEGKREYSGQVRRHALMRAASLDSPRVVKLLLIKGLKSTLKMTKARRPYESSLSCGRGHDLCVTRHNKTSVRLRRRYQCTKQQGETALIMAAQLESYVGAAQFLGDRDSAAAVKVLLARGAKAHIRTRNGNTALKWAKAKGHTKTIKLLRNAGATN